MGTENIIATVKEVLTQLQVKDGIGFDDVRPVAIPSAERKKLAELEKELDRAMEALKQDPDLPNLLYNLANLHLGEGNFGRAIVLYERCLLYTSPSPRD